ncbi:pentatricopeptide repeat-containing protein At2g33680-like [Selaginella moellendorffii]|uniref:pentatricopeptide repeat-containing protein At2g33680-like n=1 Tax=Selaginella moellendorffii TaxID=88036 RepID=UPI000D1CCD08|nr:pentatricopeptide repeat-containing protein At2g33680-like [Selaginella moellendorffii]|eukprot:XP_024531912.1 pentatricopeptide repeat-containing protein At2g33680-like [Selaginella moellendorffii]
MEDSQAVFDRTSRLNVVCWNALILGYAENGDDAMALGWFEQFMQCCGGVADSWTFVGVIRACSSLASRESVESRTGTKIISLEKGMAVDSRARSGCQSSIYVASSLIDMYAKCGSMVDARRVFDKAPSATRDVVLWTTLVLGYAENGDGEAALEIFQLMKSEGCHLDVRVFAAALKACAVCSDLRSGEAVYEETCRHGIGQDPVVVSCLVDLYGKCGSVAGAQRTFDCSGPCGTVTWNALIAAYARQGDSGKVFETFSKMLDEAAAREQGESNGAGLYLKPDSLTLVSVLTACSHAGLADKGKHILEAMPGKFGIQPSIEHYHCLVDLLGRANRVEEALAMVEAMPFEASAVTWTTLLGSCKSVEDIEVAKVAFDSLVSLNDRKSSAYVLMAEALNK